MRWSMRRVLGGDYCSGVVFAGFFGGQGSACSIPDNPRGRQRGNPCWAMNGQT